MQTASAFGQVQGALSFFVSAYTRSPAGSRWSTGSPASRRSIEPGASARGRRARRIDAAPASGCRRRASPSACPNGAEIVRVPELVASRRATTCSSPARPAPARPACSARSAASGRSATARSTCPRTRSVMVLPQRAYLPLGTLKATLTYPKPRRRFAIDEVGEALKDVGLGHLVDAPRRGGINGRTGSRAASSSASASPARSCSGPTGCSSTRRPARSTRPPRRRSTGCSWSACPRRRSSRSATGRASPHSTSASSPSARRTAATCGPVNGVSLDRRIARLLDDARKAVRQPAIPVSGREGLQRAPTRDRPRRRRAATPTPGAAAGAAIRALHAFIARSRRAIRRMTVMAKSGSSRTSASKVPDRRRPVRPSRRRPPRRSAARGR